MSYTLNTILLYLSSNDKSLLNYKIFKESKLRFNSYIASNSE